MKINYKNANQTFIKNIEKYIEIKSKLSTYIINVYSETPNYLNDLLKKHRRYHNLLNKIKLSICVNNYFFCEECVYGKNIVNSPLFDGYFKICTKDFNYFITIYNNEILFYTFCNSNTREMEHFCKRRFFL